MGTARSGRDARLGRTINRRVFKTACSLVEVLLYKYIDSRVTFVLRDVSYTYSCTEYQHRRVVLEGRPGKMDISGRHLHAK